MNVRVGLLLLVSIVGLLAAPLVGWPVVVRLPALLIPVPTCVAVPRRGEVLTTMVGRDDVTGGPSHAAQGWPRARRMVPGAFLHQECSRRATVTFALA